MADNIQATPRNEILGLLYDAMSGGLGWMQSPQRTQQMQGLAGLLQSTRIPETTARLAYGEPLTTGAGGLGGTSRVRPEVLEAGMNVAPLVGPAARLAGRGVAGVGRMAGQEINAAMMGERGGLLGAITPQPMYAAPKAPRMSAAEAQALGYWHDIGAGKKLPIPISQMVMNLQPIANLPPKIVASAEKMQGGAIVPFVGDRSAAGQNLLGIGDVQFQTPVTLEGGYDFMRIHSPTGSIWASEKGAAQALQNKINAAAELGGGDVFGVYSAMGPESMNFNTMMSDALLEQMKSGKITKKNIAAFDKEVKALRPEWKGVMNPDSRAQLESNGALRHVFVDRMQLDQFQNAGFPNIAYTRYAITDPLLLNEPMYSGGLAIGKMKPNADLITNPVYPHKTYDTQLSGEYFGGFEKSLPKEVLFPDWYKLRREIKAPESGDVRSFQLSAPIQKTNQEWLDNVMNYIETQKSLLD